MGELLKLSGIAIILIGLALRLRTTLVVVVAALVTGLTAGLPLFSNEGVFTGIPVLTFAGKAGIINMLGKAFAENRLVTLFIVTLPIIGLAERYGLQEQAALFIRRFKVATAGRLAIVYQAFRILHGVLGIRLNGHPSFVRPLIYPMSIGAAEAQLGAASKAEIPDESVELIKANGAASENFGNFYGQNLSPVQPGILLVYGAMRGLGYDVSLWSLVFYTIPVVVASFILGVIQFIWLDAKLNSRGKRGANA
jgi:uncharacterized membrane protein